MIMTAASVLFAACCAAVAVWNIVQRGKLEQQLVSTYDALSEKEREYVHLKEEYDLLCVEYDGLHVEYEKVVDELGEALGEAEEARQRTEDGTECSQGSAEHLELCRQRGWAAGG